MKRQRIANLRNTALTLLLLSGMLVTSSSTGFAASMAADIQQQSAAEAHCYEGMFLLLTGFTYRAKPLLTKSVEVLRGSSRTDPDTLMLCGIMSGMTHLMMSDVVSTAETFQMVADVAQATGDEQYEWIGGFGKSVAYTQQGRYDTAIVLLTELLSQIERREQEATASANNMTPLEATMLRVAKIATLNNYGVSVASLIDRRNYAEATSDDTLESYEPAIDAFTKALALVQQRSNATQSSIADLLMQLLQENLDVDPFTAILIGPLLQDLERQGPQSQDDELMQQIFTMLLPALMQSDGAMMTSLLDGLLVATFDILIQSIEPVMTLNLSAVYDWQGDRKNAERYLKQAERLIANAPTTANPLLPVAPIFAKTGQANIQMLRGSMAYAEQDYDDARLFYSSAISLTQELGIDVLTAEAHRNLGFTMDALGETAIALHHYERAMDLNEHIRAVTDGSVAQSIRRGQTPLRRDNTPTGGQQLFMVPGNVYERAIDLYAQQAETHAKAFWVAERNNARLFVDLLRNQRVELLPADGQQLADLQQAYAAQRYTQLALQQAQQITPADAQMLSFFLTVIFNRPVDFQRWFQEDVAAATAQYEALRQQIMQDGEPLRSFIPDAESLMTAEEVQADLTGQETSLIAFYVLPDRVIGWVVDEKGLRQVVLPITRTSLNSEIDSLNAFIETHDKADEANLRAQASELYEQLFRPLESLDLHRRIILIPHDALHRLPFAALWDETGAAYLFEKYTLSYAPSATALRVLQQNQNKDNGHVLVIGDPDPKAALPAVREGLIQIAKRHDSQPLLSRQATETALRGKSETADRIFVSTHAFYDAADPLATYVSLAPSRQDDGKLEVREAFSLNLRNANLVVLVACQTDAGELGNSGEVINLTRALLYAGTPTTVTTLWNVDEKASGYLLQSFDLNIDDYRDPAEALQATQMEILQQKQWQHPYFWAAFIVTGASHFTVNGK